MNTFRKNIDSIIDELFGERTDFPLFTRLLAFAIDFLILTFTSYLIARTIAEDFSFTISFSTGASVWLAYFSLGNSKLCNGQTIGKRIFRVRAVDKDNQPLTAMQSVLRALPISLVSNAYPLMRTVIMDFENVPLELTTVTTMICLLAGEVYFPIVTLHRRCLHDLIASSYVVSKKHEATIENSKLRLGVMVVYFLLVVILLALYVVSGITAV